MELASNIDTTISEADLFTHLVVQIPPGVHKTGSDELGANIALAERFLVHEAIIKIRFLCSVTYLNDLTGVIVILGS